MATTVTAEQIEKRIATALEEFGADPELIKPEARFEEDLDVDSLDIVELAQIMDDEYGIQLSPESMEGVKTVQDAVNVVLEAAK